MKNIDKKLIIHMMFSSILFFDIVFTVALFLVNFTGEGFLGGNSGVGLWLLTIVAIINLAAIFCCILNKDRLVHFISLVTQGFIHLTFLVLAIISIGEFGDSSTSLVFIYWIANMISYGILIIMYIEERPNQEIK